MENLEYLEKMKKDDGDTYLEKADWVYRKLKALEIIAEELIKTNGILENIESATFIKLRG